MTEFEKMRSEQLFNFTDKEVMESIAHAKKICTRLRQICEFDEGYRELIEELIPGIPKSAIICAPFSCDHGSGIRLAENVFINGGCTFLDGGYITIGENTLIGPNCCFYTPQHPFDHVERRKPQETEHSITIGKDCWLGGNVVICPGVTIGDRCIIGAGSVVTHDIEPDSVVAGNPARIIRKGTNAGK